MKQSVLFLLLILAQSILAQPISIMTFNVENLFDTVDDEGKNDETYLPASEKNSRSHVEKCNGIDVEYWREQCLYWDWNDTVVDRKLTAIGLAIKQVDNGQGPDIIAFQEVENRDILERLRKEQLAGLDYQPAVLIEGNDSRGIDVAFLSRFPVLEVRLHNIQFVEAVRSRVGDTRPILQASFELPDGTRLTGFAVHFPAPFHPTVMRENAYSTLNGLLQEIPANQPVFAAGDFNTTREENRQQDILHRWARPYWQLAHDFCMDCPGSSYYAPAAEWSFLDMILWRGAGSWRLTASYLANGSAEQQTEQGTPKRFRLPEASGVSDHWPVVMVIEQ